MEVRYVKTRRGAASLVVAGFCYIARKKRGARVYWSCKSRVSECCSARAVTHHGKLSARAGTHTHAAHDPMLHRHAAIESLIEILPD